MSRSSLYYPLSHNELDDDCDGEVDEAGALNEVTWYPDEDNDGFGSDTVMVIFFC